MTNIKSIKRIQHSEHAGKWARTYRDGSFYADDVADTQEEAYANALMREGRAYYNKLNEITERLIRMGVVTERDKLAYCA